MIDTNTPKFQLFLRQRELLLQFLKTGAITQEQFNKSYGDLKEKMGFADFKEDEYNA